MHQNVKRTICRTAVHGLFVVLVAAADVLAARHGDGRRMMTFAHYLTFPRMWLSLLAALGGLALVMRAAVSRRLRGFLMAGVFLLFGVSPLLSEVMFFVGLAPHPSPLCAITKPVLFSLKSHQVIWPPVFAAVLALIGVLSVAGNKLFWAGPARTARCSTCLLAARSRPSAVRNGQNSSHRATERRIHSKFVFFIR